MREIAFTLRPGSDMYELYMIEENEQQKLHNLAQRFFENHGFARCGRYAIGERLTLDLTKEEREKYAQQLMADTDDYGLYRFKMRSPMQKAWEKEVYSLVDRRALDANELWWLDFIHRGRRSMWSKGDTVYGYLLSYDEDITPSDGMELMPVDEYDALVEQMNKRESAKL